MSSSLTDNELKFNQLFLAMVHDQSIWASSMGMKSFLRHARPLITPDLFPKALARVTKSVCADLTTAKLQSFIVAMSVAIIGGGPCVFGRIESYDFTWTLEMTRVIASRCRRDVCSHHACVESQFHGMSHIIHNTPLGISEIDSISMGWGCGGSGLLVAWLYNNAQHDLKLLSDNASLLERLLHVPMIYAHTFTTEDVSVLALNVSEASLHAILSSSSSSSSSEYLDTFVMHTLLAHNTTTGLYHKPKQLQGTEGDDTICMLSYLSIIKTAWSALLNAVDFNRPRRWALFRTKLYEIGNRSCSIFGHAMEHDNGNDVSIAHSSVCRLPAIECFKLFEHAEINSAIRAAQIVEEIVGCTPLPDALARLVATYEVDSSLRHTLRTIETGNSVAVMF